MNFYDPEWNHFVEKKEFLIKETVRQNLIMGLRRLYATTIVNITDSELVVNEKMNLRRLVAPIVRKLVNDGVEDSGYMVISQCKDYYESDETCWDIRNWYYDGE